MRALFFYAEWSSHSMELEHIIRECIANNLIKIHIDNVNISEPQIVSGRYKIKSIPTLLLVENNGKEIKRHIGDMTKEQFLQFLE